MKNTAGNKIPNVNIKNNYMKLCRKKILNYSNYKLLAKTDSLDARKDCAWTEHQRNFRGYGIEI